MKNPPEDIPGNVGAHGIRATFESLSAGKYYMLPAWFLPPDFYNPKRLKTEVIQEYFDIHRLPLEISVNDGPAVLNTGGITFSLKDINL